MWFGLGRSERRAQLATNKWHALGAIPAVEISVDIVSQD
jgi:hypothetical protein